MQLFPILLIAVVLAGDGGLVLAADRCGLQGWSVAAVAWCPVAGLLVVTGLFVSAWGRRISGSAAPRAVLWAEHLVRAARWLVLLNHAAAVLVFGWLATVRGVVGDRILVDELLTILPPVLGLLGTWWLYYPIERRVRESILIRRLDQGRAVHPTPTRAQYVLAQARLHLLFLLVPILIILTLAESIDAAASAWSGGLWNAWVADVATFGAAIAVVATAPLLARLVLDVELLPPGSLHRQLMAVCEAHGVRVRRLLVWKTHGSMVNAAVMGLVWPLRYVLLTDALLESMDTRQLEAVMAHEVAHLRRHHMPWMMAALVALLIGPVVLIDGVLRLSCAVFPILAEGLPPWAGLTVSGLSLACALGAFGWVSRRFERQADAFAAVHLSRRAAHPCPGSGPPAITAEAVEAVRGALGTIARLDLVRPARPSWRHGSIAWRQAYLSSLAGLAAGRLPIDRQVVAIKRLTVVLLVLAAACVALVAATLDR
jgi:Zn-dependent protease with chaperone function